MVVVQSKDETNTAVETILDEHEGTNVEKLQQEGLAKEIKRVL